jgi:hypothetical protein
MGRILKYSYLFWLITVVPFKIDLKSFPRSAFVLRRLLERLQQVPDFSDDRLGCRNIVDREKFCKMTIFSVELSNLVLLYYVHSLGRNTNTVDGLP